jgi:CubicO group peptidase (beta-lactamase class C family)
MPSQPDLARAFDRLDRAHALNGAVLIAHRGAVVFERAYGFASKQLGVPNTPETKFHIASLTKMFVAMAALILSERGLIRLGDRPAAYLPELAALDEGITIHHLLSHTSGLRDIYAVPHLRFKMSKLKPGRAYGHAVVDGQLVNADNDKLSGFRTRPVSCIRRYGT